MEMKYMVYVEEKKNIWDGVACFGEVTLALDVAKMLESNGKRVLVKDRYYFGIAQEKEYYKTPLTSQ